MKKNASSRWKKRDFASLARLDNVILYGKAKCIPLEDKRLPFRFPQTLGRSLGAALSRPCKSKFLIIEKILHFRSTRLADFFSLAPGKSETSHDLDFIIGQ